MFKLLIQCSRLHEIYMERVVKVALSADDYQRIMADGVGTKHGNRTSGFVEGQRGVQSSVGAELIGRIRTIVRQLRRRDWKNSVMCRRGEQKG